jgi:Phosphorylase superfamily
VPLNSSFTVVTATSLEAKAARRELPNAEILKAGIALHCHPERSERSERSRRSASDTAYISCGLAGGLRDDLATGTVVIPRDVRRPDGTMLHCDDELTESLIAAARSLGIEPVVENIVTAASVVVGKERKRWAEEGYAAADMETGLLTGRIAAVRVILDTPLHELSPDWLNPTIAMLKPWNWPQAIWLAREAPRSARLAARVIAAMR